MWATPGWNRKRLVLMTTARMASVAKTRVKRSFFNRSHSTAAPITPPSASDPDAAQELEVLEMRHEPAKSP